MAKAQLCDPFIRIGTDLRYIQELLGHSLAKQLKYIRSLARKVFNK